jgi:signal transduction histidine kinase
MESTTSDRHSREDWTIWVRRAVLFVLIYAISGRLSLELTYYHDSATLVAWPPAGVALAGLILYGRQMWPCVFVGALIVNLGLPIGFLSSLGIALGGTFQAFIGAALLTEVFDFRPTLERQRDGISFLLVGVLGSTTIAATFGTGSVFLSGGLANPFGSVWLLWWLSNMGGVLVVAPLLLMLAEGSPAWESLTLRVEFWIISLALVATTGLVFFGPDLGLIGYAMSAIPFPCLVWAGSRCGARGATLASSLIIVIATIGTARGSGPFGTGTTTEAMLILWPYSIFIGITAFTLAAIVEQRDLADRNFRLKERERMGFEKQKLLLEERERITRELHDGLGGQLHSVLSDVEAGQAVQSEVAESLRRAIDDIRIVIDSLDPETTDLSTSLGKLRARLRSILGRNQIELIWAVEEIGWLDEFPPETSLRILQIIQESVTNMLGHPNVGCVEVRIRSSDDPTERRLLIQIHDDGSGLPTDPQTQERLIGSIRSRAFDLGAKVRVENTDSGTQVRLSVPLPS